MMAKDPARRPASAQQLASELGALARDPAASTQSALASSARGASSPMVAGGAERALEAALSQGPERVYLERLQELLQEPARHVVLQSETLVEARSLLQIALDRCVPARQLALRIHLSGPGARLHEQLLQKLSLAPDTPLERLCQQLAEPAGVARGRCLVEVQCSALPSERQRAELEALASAGKAYELALALLLTPPGGEPAAGGELPGFELLRLPGAALGAREFAERVRLWVAAASADRWQVSADGLRLLHHLCREHRQAWPQLLQASLLVSAAAGLPVITSWAVQAAHAHGVPLHALGDVPVEWRSAPRRWPSAQVAALLARLREAESPAPPPTTDPG
jgi:hypothetical protein